MRCVPRFATSCARTATALSTTLADKHTEVKVGLDTFIDIHFADTSGIPFGGELETMADQQLEKLNSRLNRVEASNARIAKEIAAVAASSCARSMGGCAPSVNHRAASDEGAARLDRRRHWTAIGKELGKVVRPKR